MHQHLTLVSQNMLSYILRRILQMLPTLLGVILLIFFLFKFFGGDPVEIMAGMKASPSGWPRCGRNWGWINR
jgi:ABC-type dipeptide/oligopeptide/nickel transport system permease component